VAVSYVTKGSIEADTSGSASYTVTMPAHAVNDILIVATWNAAGSDTTITGTGWAEIAEVDSTFNANWAWKRATATTGEGPTVACSATDVFSISYVFRGTVVSGTPYVDATTASNMTAETTPDTATITTTASNQFAVSILCIDGDSSWSSGNPPSGWSQVTLDVDNVGTDVGFNLMTQTKAVAGDIAAAAIGTYGESQEWASLTFAFDPAQVRDTSVAATLGTLSGAATLYKGSLTSVGGSLGTMQCAATLDMEIKSSATLTFLVLQSAATVTQTFTTQAILSLQALEAAATASNGAGGTPGPSSDYKERVHFCGWSDVWAESVESFGWSYPTPRTISSTCTLGTLESASTVYKGSLTSSTCTLGTLASAATLEETFNTSSTCTLGTLVSYALLEEIFNTSVVATLGTLTSSATLYKGSITSCALNIGTLASAATLVEIFNISSTCTLGAIASAATLYKGTITSGAFSLGTLESAATLDEELETSVAATLGTLVSYASLSSSGLPSRTTSGLFTLGTLASAATLEEVFESSIAATLGVLASAATLEEILETSVAANLGTLVFYANVTNAGVPSRTTSVLAILGEGDLANPGIEVVATLTRSSPPRSTSVAGTLGTIVFSANVNGGSAIDENERVPFWGWSDTLEEAVEFWGWYTEPVGINPDERVPFWGWADTSVKENVEFWGWYLQPSGVTPNFTSIVATLGSIQSGASLSTGIIARTTSVVATLGSIVTVTSVERTGTAYAHVSGMYLIDGVFSWRNVFIAEISPTALSGVFILGHIASGITVSKGSVVSVAATLGSLQTGITVANTPLSIDTFVEATLEPIATRFFLVNVIPQGYLFGNCNLGSLNSYADVTASPQSLDTTVAATLGTLVTSITVTNSPPPGSTVGNFNLGRIQSGATLIHANAATATCTLGSLSSGATLSRANDAEIVATLGSLQSGATIIQTHIVQATCTLGSIRFISTIKTVTGCRLEPLEFYADVTNTPLSTLPHINSVGRIVIVTAIGRAILVSGKKASKMITPVGGDTI